MASNFQVWAKLQKFSFLFIISDWFIAFSWLSAQCKRNSVLHITQWVIKHAFFWGPRVFTEWNRVFTEEKHRLSSEKDIKTGKIYLVDDINEFHGVIGFIGNILVYIVSLYNTTSCTDIKFTVVAKSFRTLGIYCFNSTLSFSVTILLLYMLRNLQFNIYKILFWVKRMLYSNKINKNTAKLAMGNSNILFLNKLGDL